MATAALEPTTQHAVRPPLPARLKLLCVSTLHQGGGWIARALAAEHSGAIRVEEAVGATSAMSRLRDEAFDAVLVIDEPGVFHATDFVVGLRAGGHDEPTLVLGEDASPDVVAACYEAGADAYCAIHHTTPRLMLWELSSALRRCELQRETRRLQQLEQQRLTVEHQEAERLLAEQRGLLVELDALRRQQDIVCDEHGVEQPCSRDASHAVGDLPAALVANYRDVLRAYVIMGIGNLSVEMAKLAELLASSSVSAGRAVQLHLDVLEQLVHGLGARSARHVMNRADLLILELMIHLADGYRRRYRDVEHPPEQLLLPGFGLEREAA